MKSNGIESHRMVILDMSKPSEVKKLTMKKYEIWINQEDNLNKPEKVDEIEATSFKIACVIHEHQRSIDSLKLRMQRNDSYIQDIHFGVWYYDPKTNSNPWIGKYYETEQEALKTF